MGTLEIIEVLRDSGVPDITSCLEGLESDPIPLGSSGQLYHAQSAKGEVAIRAIRIFVVHNKTNQRLLKDAADELLVWLHLQHDFIIPLLGVACFQEQPALVSPWMRFGNLKDFRIKQPSFDWLKMGIQVSCAIAYLHDNGLIHGDIKAQNVLVSDDGSAKLTGFGNSVLRELTSHYRGGKDFSILSLRWTAPEVLEGANAKSPEADVYALGMTLLEIVTGRVPFNEISSDQNIILAVMSRTIPSRPEELDSHDQIWRLLAQCWGSDPKVRPTARHVYDALIAIP